MWGWKDGAFKSTGAGAEAARAGRDAPSRLEGKFTVYRTCAHLLNRHVQTFLFSGAKFQTYPRKVLAFLLNDDMSKQLCDRLDQGLMRGCMERHIPYGVSAHLWFDLVDCQRGVVLVAGLSTSIASDCCYLL